MTAECNLHDLVCCLLLLLLLLLLPGGGQGFGQVFWCLSVRMQRLIFKESCLSRCVRQESPGRVLLVVRLHALRAWQAVARGHRTTLHASNTAGAWPAYLNSASILKYLCRTPKYPPRFEWTGTHTHARMCWLKTHALKYNHCLCPCDCT